MLTNDGDLALKLTHPRQKVEKEYMVTLDQSFSNDIIERLVAGVHTPEGRAAAKSVKRVSSRRVRMVLVTGMKRQIRVMFEALHLKVTKLVRIRIGQVTGGGLELGKCHLLDEEDILALQGNPAESRSMQGAAPSSHFRPTSKPARKMARRPSQKSAPRGGGKRGSQKRHK